MISILVSNSTTKFDPKLRKMFGYDRESGEILYKFACVARKSSGNINDSLQLIRRLVIFE